MSNYAPTDVTQQTLADSDELARIQTAGTVFFEEGFESPDALDQFFNLRERDRGAQKIISDGSLAHSGNGVLQLDTIDRDGAESDAGITNWFTPGHDTVYFRRWIRFAEDYDQGHGNHVGGSLRGVSGDDRNAFMGMAGQRPNGDDRFNAGFEPSKERGKYDAPGAMMLYTYWMDMPLSSDGIHYYGQRFAPPDDKLVFLKRGVWHCLEHMIAANTVDGGDIKADGEMAAWIDGHLYIHLKGFRWRSTPDVTLKRMSLGMYIHQSRQDNTLWYDDVALSTGYVGTG